MHLKENAGQSKKTIMIVMHACMLEVNFGKVVWTERDNILTAITEILNKKMKLPDISQFGDGNAGKK